MAHRTVIEAESIDWSVPVSKIPASPFFQKLNAILNRHHDSIAKGLQVFVDYFLILFSFRISYAFWKYTPFRQQASVDAPGQMVTVFLSLFIIFILIYAGAYQSQSSIANVRMHRNIIKGLIFSTIFIITFTFFVRNLQIGRLQVAYFLFVSIFLLSLGRSLVDRWLLYLLKKGIGGKRVLIFGAGETGKRLAKAMEKYPKMGYVPVGFVDDRVNRVEGMISPLPVLGTSYQIREIADRFHVDEVIFAVPSADSERMNQLMRLCAAAGLGYKFVPNLQDIALQKVRSEDIDGIPVFSIKRLQYRQLNSIVKRVFDVFFSAFVLFVSLPIFCIIAVAISLDSKGPVLFRQKRVGMNGKLFTLYKFRTMHVNTPAYALHPRETDDPRITRVGRFLRRTSLDELPQFINVLKGDMSIVGPRPEMPFIVKRYSPLHRERLNVRPGITGLWQISADRNFPIHENIDHDLYYIENQSFLVDLIIIFRTLLVVLNGLGAK